MPRRATTILLTLFLAALACNVPASSATPTSTPTTPEQQPVNPTGTTAQTGVTDTPGAESTEPPAEEEPPPPSGMLDVLETNVASGTWTYEEGLVLGLKSLVGEVRLSEEYGEMGALEGTGVILEAQRYLREGTDEDVKSELGRLLAVLQVDPDRLAPFSQPETETSMSGRAPGLAAPARALQGNCVDLWVDGFPSSTPVLCFLFKQQTLGGYQTHIYYPSWWESGSVEFAYAQAAYDALAKAWPVYEAFGSMGAIDLVFTVLPELVEADTLAMVPQSEVTPERCLVLVYPFAIQTDLATSTPVTMGVFKQTIAHELFHCFQAFNYPDKFVNSSWAVHDWWGESTAEYFSNVVYPTVNFEWRWTSWFDSQALTTSMFNLSNENFEFFQHLANRVGDAGVIALLASLPAGNSYADQLTAVSGYPEIEAIYHEFGKAYLDHQVIDTSGATVPGKLTGNIPTKGVGSNPVEKVMLNVLPFTLGVKQLVFLEEKIFANSVSTGDVPGERSVRPVEVETGWMDDLPEEVITGCGVKAYRLLLTSTAVTADPYVVTIDISVVDEVECDECLLGVWELNKASFEAHMESLLANPDFGVNFIEGGWQFTFGPNADFIGKFTEFTLNYTILTDSALGDPIFTDVELFINGENEGEYYVGAPGTLVTGALNNSSVDFLQKIWMNGDLIQDSDLGDTSGPVNLSAAGEYTCSKDTLSIRNEPLDLPQNTPVDYDRVGG